MGKRSNQFCASLLLIFYVMLSVYWINKFLNRKLVRKFVRSTETNRSRNYCTFFACGNRTTDVAVGSNFEVNSVLSDWKLHRLLQAEWNGDNVTENHEMNREIIGESSFDAEYFNKNAGIKKGEKLKLGNTNISTSYSNTCKALASGNDLHWRNTIKLIAEKHKSSGPKYRSNSIMLDLFSRCKEMHEFVQPESTDNYTNSSDIQIAYSILLNRPADQTFQLLRAIYDPLNAYCLHVDIHANRKLFEFIKKLTLCFNNIFLAPARFDVAFPSSNRVKAHIECFKTLLKSNIPWRYLFSISGSIYPLRNNTVIVDYLKHRPYSNEIFPKDSNSMRFLRRYTFVHVFKTTSNRKFFVRTKKLKTPPPGNITLFRGENMFLAVREFAEFVTNSKEAKELLAWSHDTRYPDEFFWATLNMIPGVPGGSVQRQDEELSEISNIIDGEDVYTTQENFLVARHVKGTSSQKCGGKYNGNICIFGYKDLRWLLGQDNLFAGPFEMGVDRIVLECLYQNLRQPLIEDHDF